MGAIWHDVKYAARRLARSRGFAVVAIASLALGIGANTAFFSLLNAIVLRDLPVRHANQLVEIREIEPRTEQAEPLSLAMYRGIARDQISFSRLCGETETTLDVKANGSLGRNNVWMVSGGCYSMLGTRPAAGRLLESLDVNLAQQSPERVAVLGYDFWQRRFGGDPSAIGKVVEVEGVPFTIVGVAPKGFSGVSIDEEPQITIPLTAAPLVFGSTLQMDINSRHMLWIAAFARLKPGVTLLQARATLETQWPAILKEALPPDENDAGTTSFLGRRILVRSGARGEDIGLRGSFTRPLEVLMGLSGLILLLACTNLAGLMLARAAARDQEMGVRIALGAGPFRLARQTIFEGLLVAGAGACAGIGLAWASDQALIATITWNYPVAPTIDLVPDARVLSLTVALAILAGVLFSVAPAWQAVRRNPVDALQTGPRTIGGTGRLGKLLVAVQLALAVVLLSCAGLLVRSFIALVTVKTGYQSSGVLAAPLRHRPGDRTPPQNDAYWGRVQTDLDGSPGVVSAAISDILPGGQVAWKPSVAPANAPPGRGVLAFDGIISPGFFGTLGMSIVAGRDFSWSDTPRMQRVAIVSQSLARQLFPTGDAIGRLIRVGRAPELQKAEIVGVVNNARVFNPRDPSLLAVYTSLTQDKTFDNGMSLLVRADAPRSLLSHEIRQVLTDAGYEYAYQYLTLGEVRVLAAVDEQVTALLSAFFGGLGLLLAAIGLFGLVSYSVTRRTREFGIRMALGADATVVRGMVLRETATLAAMGLGLGLAGALAASRLIAGMLFGVSPHDAATLAAVSVVFFAVALLAGYLPARRAMRVDPQEALHSL